LAVGFDTIEELKPVDGDQEYVYAPVPPLAFADRVLELPLQMDAGLAVGAAAGSGLTVKVTVPVALQLLMSFTVTV